MISAIISAAALLQQSPVPNPVQPQQQSAPEVRGNEPPESNPSIEVEGSGRPILGIAFRGVDAPAEVASAAEAFVGQPATRETLVALVAALSSAYERSPVALYTVSIPEQDFAEDIVIVDLAEGWVESVQVSGSEGASHPLLEARAAKLVGEKPLSRPRYERQLALMRSIPGLTVDAGFENPNGDDSVRLLASAKQRRIEVSVAANNRGPNLVGDLVVGASGNLFRLLTEGDQLNVTVAATPKVQRYRQLVTSYTIPIGPDGLTFGATASWLRTRAKQIDIRGGASLAGVSLSYPLLRRSGRAADVSFGIDGVNSNNAAFGNVIANDRTRAARLAGSYAVADEVQNFSVTGTLSKGLDIFDARIGSLEASPTFTKLVGSATYERLLAPKLLARANATGQVTPSRVPAPELFAIGGPLIGRAFDTGFLTGDRGAGGFVELAYRPLTGPRLQTSELYLFADVATIAVAERSLLPGQSFDLASAGAGGRLRIKDFVELGVEAAAVVDRPFSGYRDDWRLSFFYSLTF